ncbi:RIP metalloprotease RseP [Flavicella marina]|uniref:RIP metalloprotease RseP n=1 Tax=Flavicella marina TaxID=1475951 RepID=UPI0012641DCA|nr:RIP metalloprotease RseP [Flavicella marina]
MEVFIKASQFLLSLSLLIVLHELGHFIPAKLFKTRVEKFYLFFDYKFSIFKKKIGDTVYGIGWIPLGGYVKISGMIDESMDTEQLALPPQPWEFRSKPAWQRLIIMLGGVIVNFILGFAIYILILFTWGENYLPNDNVKDGVWVTDSLGYDLGLQTGDKIKSIDGNKVKAFSSLPGEFVNGTSFVIERNGETIEKEVPVDFISKLIERGKGPFISPRIPFVVGGFSDTSVNKESGLKSKDLILAINNTPIKYFDEASEVLEKYKNQEVSLLVKRKKGEETVQVTLDENGKIGVSLGTLPAEDMERLGYYTLETKEYTLAEAIPAGTAKGYKTLTDYIKQLKKVFNPETGAYKGLGGFISIGSIFPSTWSWQSFWSITAFLSIMLGFMNLLPIPALDGGHVVFTLYEMITGRKPSDKFLEYAQITGFVVLMALLLFANANDVIKLFD